MSNNITSGVNLHDKLSEVLLLDETLIGQGLDFYGNETILKQSNIQKIR
jgi:hypothetical protein